MVTILFPSYMNLEYVINEDGSFDDLLNIYGKKNAWDLLLITTDHCNIIMSKAAKDDLEICSVHLGYGFRLNSFWLEPTQKGSHWSDQRWEWAITWVPNHGGSASARMCNRHSWPPVVPVPCCQPGSGGLRKIWPQLCARNPHPASGAPHRPRVFFILRAHNVAATERRPTLSSPLISTAPLRFEGFFFKSNAIESSSVSTPEIILIWGQLQVQSLQAAKRPDGSATTQVPSPRLQGWYW
jgi:hypothetical protein